MGVRGEEQPKVFPEVAKSKLSSTYSNTNQLSLMVVGDQGPLLVRMWTAGLVQLWCSSTGTGITRVELAADNFPGSVSRRHHGHPFFLLVFLSLLPAPLQHKPPICSFSHCSHFCCTSLSLERLHRRRCVTAPKTQNPALDASHHRLQAKDLLPFTKEVFVLV